MSGLIRFALTQRLFVLVLVVLMSGLGYLAAVRLPIDAFPDVSPTQVKIIVKAPGMTPEEVEARITAPLEIELLGIPNQTVMRSIAKYAITDITLDFEEGTDIYWARQQVAERLNNIWPTLPPGSEGGMAPITTPLGETFMFTVEGDRYSLADLRGVLDWVIRPALRTVPGVADVNALGGLVRSFEVVPDNGRMAARGVSIQQIMQAMEKNNRNDGAGRVTEGEEALLVRSEGRITTLDDVRAIVVAMNDQAVITLNDVAEVKLGALTRYGAVSQDGRGEVVEGLVLSLRGANARQLVNGLREKVAELQPALPEGVHINLFYDRGKLVDRAVHTVVKALYEAIVLVLVVLVLFLGNLRAALTVAAILPCSALFTFILMQQFAISANLMSLGGLAIAIGLLVDAAVVVVENLAVHLSHPEKTARLPRLHLIYRATRDVAGSIVVGMTIIALVFLPLLTLEGLEGKLFKPMALTIVFALAGSLLLSLTVIPVLASYLLRRMSHEEPWLPRMLQKLYAPFLRRCIRHDQVILAATVGLLVITAVVYSHIGKSFMPTLDEGDIVVQLEKLPSIALQQSVTTDMQVQRAILQQIPEVTRIIARVGSDELGLDPMAPNETDTFLVLKPRDQWRVGDKAALINDIRRVLEQLPGVAFNFTQPIEMRVTEMLTGTRGDVAVKLFGPDLEVLNRKTEEIAAVLHKVPGASDVFTAKNEGVQYVRIVLDRLQAGRLGLSADTMQEVLRAQIEGVRAGIIQEGLRRTPLLLRGVGDPASLASLLVSLPDGHSVPLSTLASVERVEGVVSINRELGQRYAVVRSNVAGRDLVGFVNDAKQAVQRQVQLPPGYLIRWGGQFENQQRAAARLSIVIPVGLGLILLLLYGSFRSWRQAVLVLLHIPLAMIGGVFGLWLTGEYLSVPASVGFIALMGIAVMNGVVKVNYLNLLARQGKPIDEVVVEGAVRRLRPILMTASIAALGLVPLLFATGPGSEIQRPLAIVVIGGLVTSTLLTLILLPIMYRRFGAPKELAI